MKKGQIYEGIIERVDFPNKGMIYIPEEEKYVTVKNGIPGQKVRFMINKFKRGNGEGRLLEVLENHRWRPGSRSVVFSRPVVDACTRLCPMKNR